MLLQQNPHLHLTGNIEYMNSVEIKLETWNIGTLNGKGLELCDELRGRNVDLFRHTRGVMERTWG